MARIKGAAFMVRMSTIKERFGEDSLQAVLKGMEPEYKEVLGRVLASSWYDEAVFEDFNKAIFKALSAKNLRIMEQIGELAAESSLKGVYRSSLKAGDVPHTLSRASVLWKAFHDTGELSVEVDPERNHAAVRVAGYGLPHIGNCQNLVGWIRRMIELAGGKNVRMRKRKCVCKGDDVCEMFADWD